MQGLTDPFVNLSMWQTAEVLAQRFAISRERMDIFAVESHRRLATRQADAGVMQHTFSERSFK